MKSDHLHLDFIARGMQQIETYTAGREDPLSEPLIRDAVLRNLQIIAQAAISLTEEFKARHPSIDWRGLRAFRNILVHDYMEVDITLVYRALERSLPILRQAVLAELKRFATDEGPPGEPPT